VTGSNPLDGAPADDLERAFRSPGLIETDPEYVTLYRNVVARLRTEAAGLPMGTVQTLLLERIASSYVIMKFREDHALMTPTQSKEANQQWLAATAQFNTMLAAHEDKLREAMMLDLQGVVNEAIQTIEDDETRRTIKRTLAEGFAAKGY